MRFITRGQIVHILLQEKAEITEFIQDQMIHPPEKFSIEVHLDKNRNVISVILLDIGTNTENIINILKNFIIRYKNEAKFPNLSVTFENIIRELAKQEPLYPRNLFKLDIE